MLTKVYTKAVNKEKIVNKTWKVVNKIGEPKVINKGC